eukprot:CAMPEP_0196580158 /NCGR_PEP_ID=MMETSP1081-20130531/27490_1 /TAXON_ID=36882 /ORGANISM="Pyramimonas amylifera, Strain CCMP720" /LENGTH=192 /DNA_ID=CAMNT_0041899957 /DNA_START=136 /DNA_END=714 /DNA_ORIENTATION=-
MGFFKSNSDKQRQAAESETRRKNFMNTFGGISADGHGSRVEESRVLDHAHVDMKNMPSQPVYVDVTEVAPVRRVATYSAERHFAERPMKEYAHSQTEVERRAKFAAFFDGVSVDTHGQASTTRENSLDMCHVNFQDMPNFTPTVYEKIAEPKSNLAYPDRYDKLEKSIGYQQSKSLNRDHFMATFNKVECSG